MWMGFLWIATACKKDILRSLRTDVPFPEKQVGDAGSGEKRKTHGAVFAAASRGFHMHMGGLHAHMGVVVVGEGERCRWASLVLYGIRGSLRL